MLSARTLALAGMALVLLSAVPAAHATLATDDATAPMTAAAATADTAAVQHDGDVHAVDLRATEFPVGGFPVGGIPVGGIPALPIALPIADQARVARTLGLGLLGGLAPAAAATSGLLANVANLGFAASNPYLWGNPWFGGYGPYGPGYGYGYPYPPLAPYAPYPFARFG